MIIVKEAAHASCAFLDLPIEVSRASKIRNLLLIVFAASDPDPFAIFNEDAAALDYHLLQGIPCHCKDATSSTLDSHGLGRP
jgi:hypothetical protein